MPIARFFPRRATMRDLMFVSTPSLWSLHPYLPVIRRSAAGDHQQLRRRLRRPRRNRPVRILINGPARNLFAMPETEAELLALPKIVYDTYDELLDDGWVID